MKFAIKADITAKQTIDCLILPISSKKNYTDFFKKIDSLVDNQLSKFLVAEGLVFAKGKTSWFIPNKSTIKRILLVSLIDDNKKKATELSVVDFRKIIKNIAAELKHCSDKKSVFSLVDFNLNQSLEWQIMQVIRIMNDIWYCFDKFKQNPAPKLALQQIDLVITKNSDKQLKTYINYAESIVAGMSLTKDLGNTPANVCNPTYLAAQAQSLAKQHKKLKCSILDEKKLRSLKMNTLLSVGEGSAQPSKLICLQFMNANKKAPVTALVGKGVTFDTGGISIKPAAKMDEMKYDMCGAASVLGTIKAIALLDLPINVVAVIGAAENMPGSKATRPGDIVQSMSGKTVEILNTDAEGRLVLCDALTYVQKTFKPTTIIDIATLTGACIVALGKHNSGLFSNDQQLADDLLNASKETDDLAWQLPLGAEYTQLLQSSCADIANIGGPYGGSITAACFLEKFIENCKWAHLDIAGTAWVSGNKKHATGRPVPLLVKYLINSI